MKKIILNTMVSYRKKQENQMDKVRRFIADDNVHIGHKK